MTRKPEMFIGKNHDKIKTFIVHVETSSNINALIDFVHSMRCRVFLALKPSIPVSAVRKYLRKIDGVLVMTVQPGRYGAQFMRNMIGKIRQLRNMNRNLTIEVDGSVNDKTIKLLKDAGANRFSVGSYIQKSKDVKKAISSLE
jgi:ribulose-phosphate 3-epimerase